MKMPSYFAATYNCNAYGAGTYSNSQACGTASSGGLANTGVDFWIPLVLGTVLFVSGVVFLVRSLIRRKKQATN
jgi:hypothetical protein